MTDHGPTMMTESDLREMIRSEVRELVKNDMPDAMRQVFREELHAVGLRAELPVDIDQAREDFRFLRRMRTSFDSFAGKVGTAVIVVIIGGVATVVAYGFKVWVAK